MLTWSAQAAGKTHQVKDGESIQKVLDQVEAGDTVEIMSGVYHESLHVDKERITLRGILQNGQWPRLDGHGKLNDGIVASGHYVRIEGIAVTNYKGNGIMTQGANHVVISRVRVDRTGIYGIYTTLGRNLVIEDSVATGIEDAGIYVGMCEAVDVKRNEAYANVAGIEIENSLNVLVEGNLTQDNTAGILVFTLPGLVTKKTENVIIRGNFVVDNNHRNFGAPGSVVSNVPPGTGIINLAADKVFYEDNIIRDNSTAGVVFADMSVMPNTPPDPEVEPNPDANKFLNNVVLNNGNKTLLDYLRWYHYILRNLFFGGTPEGTAEDLLPPSADLFSSDKGQDNCAINLKGYRLIDMDSFSECDANETTRGILTMVNSSEEGGVNLKFANVGEEVYASVCAGCHAQYIPRVGPSIQEIREKYKGNPEGILKFALKPTKVRKNFPEMPSQAHLGDEKILAVAKFMLAE